MLLQSSIRSVSPDIAVITLHGALTLGTSLKTVDMQIQNTIDAGAHRLVVDMSGVSYMDSAGLGALIHAAGLAREQGGGLRLSGVTPRIASMLEMTRVNSLLPMDPDESTSLRHFQS